MGRNAGWVAAAAVLARTDTSDAPHLIYVPERPLLADAVTEQVRQVVAQHGYAVIVVAETVRDGNGQPWARQVGSDGFGHVRLVGAAERLGALIEERLGYKTRFNKPGSLQRSAGTCVSTVDWEEAYLVGQVAVARAVDGARDVMVTLLRQPGPVYRAATGLASLADVAHAERRLPPEFLDDQGRITPAFLDYVHPLIGGDLPAYARLGGRDWGLGTRGYPDSALKATSAGIGAPFPEC